jgi:hypothetical protein
LFYIERQKLLSLHQLQGGTPSNPKGRLAPCPIGPRTKTVKPGKVL